MRCSADHTVDWNGVPCWRLVARAESNSFFNKMYRVRNRIESLWDEKSLFSWRYFEDRHEGHYTANDTIVVDTTEVDPPVWRMASNTARVPPRRRLTLRMKANA